MMFDLDAFQPTRARRFDGVYSNELLARRLNELEFSLNVVDEQQYFEYLVNTSVSKSQPYHRWARYREGYSGYLVQELIRRSSIDSRNHFVFDPMCGSGSTLVAAVQLGFDCLGTDVNPYAVDVTNAKTRGYSKETLQLIRAFLRKTPVSVLVEESVWKKMENCKQYFKPANVDALQSIISEIQQIEDDDARHLLFTAWLTVLEECSERKKDGNGLATRPSKIKDVWSHFTYQAHMMLSDLVNHPLPPDVTARAEQVSALGVVGVVQSFTQHTNKQLGAIIFSPPYANSFDYFESYKIELLCGYYDNDQLIEARKATIRNYRKGYGYQLSTNDDLVEMLCKEVMDRVPEKEAKAGAVDNRSRLVPNLLVGYFQDMEEVLKTFFSCMPQGAVCHIVVDQSAYLGIVIPTDLLLANIARRQGFTTTGLTRCRAAKTSAQQLKEYPYLRGILRESIVSLKKH